MCEWFDETSRPVARLSRAQKLAGNTLVIFLADNGWIQDPSADRYAPRSKQSPYEGGLRTPILVRWPGRVTPRTCDLPVSAIDIAPTVFKAVGLDPIAGLPGIDLLDEHGDRQPAARFLARSSRTMRSISTTQLRACAIAGSSRVTGS